MKKRLLSLVLCLVMVFSLFPFVASAEYAAPATQQDGTVITNPKTAQDGSKDLNLTKELSQGANGTYDLKLESWATGEVHAYTEKIPTDFVVVVDQSGSMDTRDMPTGDPTVQNNKYLEDIANGAYYFKANDGNYYRVYGVKDYLFRYYPANYWFTGDIVKHLGTDIGWFMGETDATTNIDNAFYFREVVGDQTYYIPIRTTIEGKIGTYYMRFSYPSKQTGGTYEFNREVTTYSSNGNSPWYKNVLNGNVMTGGATWAAANAAVQTLYPNDNAYTYSTINLGLAKPRTGMYINYPMYGRHLSYTKLCYRDVNGVEHEVPSNSNGRTTWEYCDDNGIARTTDSVTSARPTYSGLYTFAGTTDRITALKAALTQFADAVSKETDSFGAVNNRISIVGFSSSGYNNTELLTGETLTVSNNNGVQKDSATNSDYATALVGATNGTVGTVNPKITAAINAITANGGTQPEDGLEMAYNVLSKRAVGDGTTTYTIRSGNDKDEVVDRNTIVIFFTDGQPGDYHYSDQYSEANDVVAQALNIKQLKNKDGENLDTSIFSIGVFGESDGNPLTYPHETRTNSQGEDKAWKYLGGWMESYHDQYYPYSWYCLRRQWRPNNADGYTATPNDTIFDYMSVVSSNYPDAENFIAPTWLTGGFQGNYIAATDGVRHIDTHVTENGQRVNKYYRMASSQDTLVAAFLAAVTMNNEETGTPVTINSSAVLQDQLNLTDFDVSEASLDAKVVNYSNNAEDATLSGQLDTNESDLPNGIVKVSGFDYAGDGNYVVNNQGKKLVVTITGLTPKAFNQDLYSNVDGEDVLGAGIYGAGMDRPTVQIESPIVNVKKAVSYYVADFNAPLTVAKDATINSKNVTNGDFKMSGNDAVYQLNYASGTIAGGTVTLNSAYTTADTASITGKHVSDGKTPAETTQTVSVIPGSSVYYDDDLYNGAAKEIGDGSGYNAQVAVSPTTTEAAAGANSISITFNGTGIDIYCTTDSASGYIQAKCDGAQVQTTKNQSVTTRYNVPTVSYSGLTYGQHTVTLTILSSSHYKLDGVRVYGPVDNQNLYNDTPDEKNAAYINMREALVNNNGVSQAFSDSMTDAVLGALFVDDSSKLTRYVSMTQEEIDAGATPAKYVDAQGNDVEAGTDGAIPMKLQYESNFDAYKANSPKNEVYLNKNQAIIFQLSTAAETAAANGNLWIGLSAPDQNKNSGTVTLKEGKTIEVTSGVDMYYPITSDMLGANRVVTLTNTGDNMISVTNLKITGNEAIYNAAKTVTKTASTLSVNEPLASTLSVEDVIPMVFEPMTLRTVMVAANNGVDTEAVVEPGEPEVDPTPTPAPAETPAPEVTPDPTQAPSVHDIVKQIVSSFVSNLFRSISRLFGN